MAGLIVAWDGEDLVAAEGRARFLPGAVDAFKVGLTLFAAHGPEALFEMGQHGRVFCDLKLHDIPTQVRGAARSLASKGVWLTTVHASGGRAMVAAAVEGAGAAGSGTLVAAVTVLTSLDAAELGSLGVGAEPAPAGLRPPPLAAWGRVH